MEQVDGFFSAITSALEFVLFFPIAGIPFVIIWLLTGCVVMSASFKFRPLTALAHTVDVIRGRYNKPDDVGHFSHLESICTAALGTVGLGSIAGVAIAVTVGGPGAILWMIGIGFLAVSLKFAEVTAGHKYRIFVESTKEIFGGPFLYSEIALKKHSPKFAKATRLMYAACMLAAAFGTANIFQVSQTSLILQDTFAVARDHIHIMAGLVVLIISTVVVGGARIIGKIGQVIVPFMGLSYIGIGVYIIAINITEVPAVFHSIFTGAFTLKSSTGGMIGAFVAGAKRIIFVTEAGCGTSAVAHSPARTSEPVREGLTASVELFIPMIVSLMTGIVIVVTGAHLGAGGMGGVLVTKKAFASVSSWFPIVLSIVVPFFALTTTMAWNWYGKIAWSELFGEKTVYVFHCLFLSCAYYGVISNSADIMIRLSDCVFLFCTVPNLIALLAMRKELMVDMNEYFRKLKGKEFHDNFAIAKRSKSAGSREA